MRAKTLITVNCPKCGVDTTVIKNGTGKYLCKNCKVYFREKKNLYPTEIKKLAVAMHGLGISYRVICGLLELGNHRNTVCYWIDKHKADKEILTRELTKELETYKGTCKIINELQERLKIFENKLSIATEYRAYKSEEKRLNDIIEILEKEDCFSKKAYNKRAEREWFYARNKNIKKPIDGLTVEQIENEIRQIKQEIAKKDCEKFDIKINSEFANEKYDLDAIIAVLEKLAGQKSRP